MKKITLNLDYKLLIEVFKVFSKKTTKKGYYFVKYTFYEINKKYFCTFYTYKPILLSLNHITTNRKNILLDHIFIHN